MSEELKLCSTCGSPAERVWDPEEELVKCSNEASSCHNSLYAMYVSEWQNRPIEDALRGRAEAAEVRAAAAEARVAELETVIRGMFPIWIAAMGYCEHGRHSELMAMRNYYNGRDNPMTIEDIHTMFSLIREKDGEK